MITPIAAPAVPAPAPAAAGGQVAPGVVASPPAAATAAAAAAAATAPAATAAAPTVAADVKPPLLELPPTGLAIGAATGYAAPGSGAGTLSRRGRQGGRHTTCSGRGSGAGPSTGKRNRVGATTSWRWESASTHPTIDDCLCVH